jgi:hypothetical protein
MAEKKGINIRLFCYSKKTLTQFSAKGKANKHKLTNKITIYII